jgi:3-oxoacyl-[acyl-carrier protein] reductase
MTGMPTPAPTPAPFVSPFGLTGRVAVVTGAGSPSGIGFATARLLTGLGAAVLLTGTTERIEQRAAELAEAGCDAAALVADLTDPAQSQRLAVVAAQRWGRVDVLVNNAGMVSTAAPQPEDGPLEAMSLELWRAGLARNLDTAFLSTRAVLPLLRSGGRIVMVSSVTGPVMAMRADAAYATAKAGMTGLMRSLALDLAARGITVNAVAPGWIATGSQTADEHRQALRTPLGRSAEPAEIAAVIAFLAGPGASYLTGQVLVVDGGNSIAEQRA